MKAWPAGASAAHVIEAREAVVDAVKAELGADVAYLHSGQRRVRGKVPQRHEERVNAQVAQPVARPSTVDTVARAAGRGTRRDTRRRRQQHPGVDDRVGRSFPEAARPPDRHRHTRFNEARKPSASCSCSPVGPTRARYPSKRS